MVRSETQFQQVVKWWSRHYRIDMKICFIPVLSLFFLTKNVCGSKDTYSAVVVEYSPEIDDTIDAATNILNNVMKYVEFINIANSKVLADIIVFPEIGLKGYTNQEYYLEIPDPVDNVRPCATNTTYEAPLVQLSCAARATSTYVVVNLSEKFYDSTHQQEVHFNTDVVFDLHGAIIARYRKKHLYEEGDKIPGSRFEYFDTEFGVRFGLFTCFDIIFEDPGIILAQNFNITHFIFPTAWFSQMPFLLATQEQWYWSYTQKVVLLASNYNLPSFGSTGSGIYLGQQGAAIYSMVEKRGNFMLYADVPKQFPPLSGSNLKKIKFPEGKIIMFEKLGGIDEGMKIKKQQGQSIGNNLDTLKLKVEELDIYSTKLIAIPEGSKKTFNGTDFIVPLYVQETICQNSLCCNFSLRITSVFSKARVNITRGDDYSQLYYRLAVFDGVRHYDHIATGGLQTCAVIACTSSALSSCGKRSDDTSAEPNTLLDFFQSEFVFESIKIVGNFSNNNSFIGPNVLLAGEDIQYGSLLPTDSFVFSKRNLEEISESSFQTVKPIVKLVTAGVYGRLFSRDGLPPSGQPNEDSSSNFDLINIFLLGTAIVLIKLSK